MPCVGALPPLVALELRRRASLLPTWPLHACLLVRSTMAVRLQTGRCEGLPSWAFGACDGGRCREARPYRAPRARVYFLATFAALAMAAAAAQAGRDR